MGAIIYYYCRLFHCVPNVSSRYAPYNELIIFTYDFQLKVFKKSSKNENLYVANTCRHVDFPASFPGSALVNLRWRDCTVCNLRKYCRNCTALSQSESNNCMMYILAEKLWAWFDAVLRVSTIVFYT